MTCRCAVLLILVLYPGSWPHAAFSGARLDVAQLAWLAGDWRSGEDGEFSQETWLQPVNGYMSGVVRTFSDKKLVLHEYIFIEQQGDEVIFRFRKHFRDDMPANEYETVTMKLVEQGDQYALFENVDSERSKARKFAPAENAEPYLAFEVLMLPGENEPLKGSGIDEWLHGAGDRFDPVRPQDLTAASGTSRENTVSYPDVPQTLVYTRHGKHLKVIITDAHGTVTERVGTGTGDELMYEFRLAEHNGMKSSWEN